MPGLIFAPSLVAGMDGTAVQTVFTAPGVSVQTLTDDIEEHDD
jgi:hypothetical protein